jgi:uncharacterized damage-inducible protein DinB
MKEPARSPEEILANYAAGPARLEAVLSGLIESDLDRAASPGTWTIRQIVHHITDGDDLWKTVLKAALGCPAGPFSLLWYWDQPQDQWVAWWAYDRLPIEASLALFRANRSLAVALVQQTPGARERGISMTLRDQRERRITVGEILALQADHALGQYAWDGAGWTREPTSSLDPQADTLMAEPDHLGLFAVLGEFRHLYLPLTGNTR